MRAIIFPIMTAILTMTVLDGVCKAEDVREVKPRFKGVELYSWKVEGDGWVYVLIDGTNRLKTEDEVKGAKGRIQGADGLKKALARLAVGEQVSWDHRVNGFVFPPETTRKEIQEAAREAEIELRIRGPKE